MNAYNIILAFKWMRVNALFWMREKIVSEVEIMNLKRLKNLREDKDMLQADVAKILQITRQQYSLYETEKRTLPIDLLDILATYYETSTDYLLGRTNIKEPYPRAKK